MVHFLNNADSTTQIHQPLMMSITACILFLPTECVELCPLEQFVELTKSKIPEDWTKECGLGSIFPHLSKSKATLTTLGFSISPFMNVERFTW